MANNSNLPVGSSNFSDIKKDFINYLVGQDEFKDYNFSGSRMNVLCDLAAYATLYMQQYSNAAMFESFIRTANKRSSIVQKAQDLGYLPSTIKASTNTIRLTGTHSLNVSVVNIPIGTRFTASTPDGKSYDYINWNQVQILRNSANRYTAKMTLVQGTISQYEFDYTVGQKIILRDKDIDRDYIRVYIDENEWTDWTNKSMVNTTGGSTVYYIRETLDGNTEIYFGEGKETDIVETGGTYVPEYVGGVKPIDGQTIRIQVLKTSGKVANGSTDIAFADSIDNFTISEILENPDDDPDYTGAAGGGDAESMERIRSLAPVLREAQRRCVTKLDYETFVSAKFGNYIQAIQCYGDSDRPGYAFISIKPTDGLSLTTTQKQDIETFLDEFNIATVTPKVVDPDYLYINHVINVNYRAGSLPEGSDYLRTQIVNAVSDYYTEQVEIFNKSFHVSKMLTYVDDCHQSVLGSSCKIELVKELVNFYKTPMAGVTFANPLTTEKFYTTEINYTPNSELVSIKATDSGYLVLGPFSSGVVTTTTPYTDDDFDHTNHGSQTLWYNIGTIDYTTGRMDYDFGVLDLESRNFDAAKVVFYASPEDVNIYVNDGSLCVYEYELRPEYTTINLEVVNK